MREPYRVRNMTCGACKRSFQTGFDYCPVCSNPSEGMWQMLRQVEKAEEPSSGDSPR